MDYHENIGGNGQYYGIEYLLKIDIKGDGVYHPLPQRALINRAA
jgi:hypothetical protein